MINLISENLELRGIANKQSKSGNVYYIINVENCEGTALQFYAKDASGFDVGLKKGDMVNLTFTLTYYKNQEQLVVCAVRKCE